MRFFLMKIYEFRLVFHWSVYLRVQLTIFQLWFREWPGDKPFSEPIMVSLLTHICVTRPQWVKWPIYKLVWRIDIFSCEITLGWLSQDLPNFQYKLLQAMLEHSFYQSGMKYALKVVYVSRELNMFWTKFILFKNEVYICLEYSLYLSREK